MLSFSSAMFFVLLSFSLVFVSMLSVKPRPFVQSFIDVHTPRHLHVVNQELSASFYCFCFFLFLFLWRFAFSKYFCTIAVFSLYEEYVVRFSLPGGVLLPCDPGLNI